MENPLPARKMPFDASGGAAVFETVRRRRSAVPRRHRLSFFQIGPQIAGSRSSASRREDRQGGFVGEYPVAVATSGIAGRRADRGGSRHGPSNPAMRLRPSSTSRAQRSPPADRAQARGVFGNRDAGEKPFRAIPPSISRAGAGAWTMLSRQAAQDSGDGASRSRGTSARRHRGVRLHPRRSSPGRRRRPRRSALPAR